MPAPDRLVSLTPSNTELVAFLGLAERLVGVDDFSDWPPKVQELEQLGPDLQIDVERVAALDPDLVLCSRSVPGMEAVNEAVAQAGLPHLVLAPKSLDEVIGDARRLGEHLGVPERGARLAQAMAGDLASTSQAVQAHLESADCEPVRVYWEWWPKPAIAAGGPGWMSELLDRAGGVNVFSDRDEESPEVQPSEVQAADPDLLAACWQGSLHAAQSVERVLARKGWENVAVLHEDRVLLLPEALFGRPGPRLVEGAAHLATCLHPPVADALGAPYAWVPSFARQALGDALGQGRGR